MPVGNPHGRPFIAPKKQILAFLWRIANQEPARGVGQINLMMECQMEQKISGISKFSEKRTTSRGQPEFSKQSFRNIPFHLILYRNFRKFWLNGSRPLFRKFRSQCTNQEPRRFLVSYPPQKRQYFFLGAMNGRPCGFPTGMRPVWITPWQRTREKFAHFPSHLKMTFKLIRQIPWNSGLTMIVYTG